MNLIILKNAWNEFLSRFMLKHILVAISQTESLTADK